VLAAAAVVFALAILVWAYGVYSYVQMVRHRQRGVPPFSVIWPERNLTPRGLAYRRRALQSYALFILLAIVLILLARITGS
jgi:hypothetical protein